MHTLYVLLQQSFPFPFRKKNREEYLLIFLQSRKKKTFLWTQCKASVQNGWLTCSCKKCVCISPSVFSLVFTLLSPSIWEIFSHAGLFWFSLSLSLYMWWYSLYRFYVFLVRSHPCVLGKRGGWTPTSFSSAFQGKRGGNHYHHHILTADEYIVWRHTTLTSIIHVSYLHPCFMYSTHCILYLMRCDDVCSILYVPIARSAYSHMQNNFYIHEKAYAYFKKLAGLPFHLISLLFFSPFYSLSHNQSHSTYFYLDKFFLFIFPFLLCNHIFLHLFTMIIMSSYYFILHLPISLA